MTDRRWWALLTLIIAFALVRVATTFRVFSQIIDEPAHITAGYDILTKGYYNTDIHHPPLPRILFALPFRHAPEPTYEPRANELLLWHDAYAENLARMRMGNLVFVALAILAVALWGRQLFTPNAGLLAALMFSALPPVLAHGGLATTDMALAATLPLALYAFTLLLERPSGTRTFLFAIALALGLLAKYSFVVFFPAGALVLLIARRRFPFAQMLAATAIAFLAVWGAYAFRVQTLAESDPRGVELTTRVLHHETWAHVRMPAPLYVLGLLDVKNQDLDPPRAILFDEVKQGGWRYYFPLALFFKTPIPFLILALAGVGLLLVRRNRIEIVIIAAVILGIAMTSHIDIGVRHILPIYAPLAIAAAVFVLELRKLRVLHGVLLAWLVIGPLLQHPDYLAWFNAFAGKEPYHVLNDSNLDWGQDVLRLSEVVREEHIPRITTSLASNAPLAHLFPAGAPLQAMQPAHGWVAISELNIALGRDYSPEVRAWLDALLKDRPYRRVGASIRLYHFD